MERKQLEWRRRIKPGRIENGWSALDERRAARSALLPAGGWCRRVICWLGHEEDGTRLSAKNTGLTYEKIGPRRPDLIYISRARVHDAVGSAIKERLGDTCWLAGILALYQNEKRAPQETPRDAGLLDEASTLARRIDTLLDREMDAAERRDVEELASIKRQREEYKKRLVATKTAIAALGSPQDFDAGTDELVKLLAAGHDFGPLWDTEAFSDQMRAVIVEGMVAAVCCRVERVPGQWAWRREVEEVRFKWPFDQWRG